MVALLVMLAVRVLQVTSMARALTLWAMALLTGGVGGGVPAGGAVGTACA